MLGGRGAHMPVGRLESDMAQGFQLTRRRLLAGMACGATALSLRPASAQVTDLRGFDALWRGGEEQIEAFFPNADFIHEGLTIDLPQHADVGSSVPMTIRLDSGMTDRDYPRVVHVVAHKNPSTHVLSAWFTPASGKAEFSTRIRLEQSQMVTAVAEMSDGRHIRVDRDITVSFGACGQVGTGTDDDIYNFKPQSRVNVPATAPHGAIIPVRALISHPMETGMRLDGMEEWVRRRIIATFGCTYNGSSVFRARLYPAMATNPYFQFYARAENSGLFNFSWYDTQDITFTNKAVITVL
jgi:predicted secreted protein